MTRISTHTTIATGTTIPGSVELRSFFIPGPATIPGTIAIAFITATGMRTMIRDTITTILDTATPIDIMGTVVGTGQIAISEAREAADVLVVDPVAAASA